MGKVNAIRRVELIGRNVVNLTAGGHVLSQNLLHLLGKRLLGTGLPAEDIIERLAGGFIVVVSKKDLISTLPQIICGGTCGGLQRRDCIFLLLAPFYAWVRLILKNEEKPAGDGLFGAELVD